MSLTPRHAIYGGLSVVLALLVAVAVQRTRQPAQPPQPPPPGGTAQRLSESGGKRSTVDQPVNLLDLVDPAKDSVIGKWEKSGSTLRTPYVAWGRVQIPCIPPPEYDLRVVVTKRNGRDSFNVGLSTGERQFMIILDGNGGTASGVDLIDHQGFSENETTYKKKVFTIDRKTVIQYSVRKQGVRVLVDDKEIFEWKGPFDRIELMPQWAVPDPLALFVGTFETEFDIEELKITPIGGTLKLFR